MHEQEVADQLRSEGVDLIVSLPCDKNKGFTDLIHEEFRVVDVTREEDGVGICAGAALMGKRAVISIQSSGLGNMMNALMSLTDCYKLPLVVLASWRGVDGEKIEAQIPFNSKIPQMLDVYGIHHCEVEGPEDIPRVGDSIREAFGRSEIHVVLSHPKLWEGAKRVGVTYPPRARSRHIEMDDTVAEPSLTRLQAIRAVMDCVGDGDIVVSNIGVPSKEVMASKDRPLNFYMLGSYTQATPIGLGMSLFTDRRVVVVDGDGSLLGSSIFPVLSGLRPSNLKIVCLDNGTFGSTGNQMNQAYADVNLGAVAEAYGIPRGDASDREGITRLMEGDETFVHVFIVPFNSDSPNIPYSAAEIRNRFMGAI